MVYRSIQKISCDVPYVLSVDCRTCGLESRCAVDLRVNRVTINLSDYTNRQRSIHSVAIVRV